MLNDIQKTESEALELVEKSKREAETIVASARAEAAAAIKKAHEEVQAIKSSAIIEGQETGNREATKITTQANDSIAKQQSSFDDKIKEVADRIAKKIIETF